ncbi:hypothetical protein [Rhizobium leguminosarum]|uniref:hypothetical protein n=1 Tax=Rhizobium leguminosarum TaxID=384 RepID=UPI0013EE8D90|nr:hypothetical protein [Rhizobium leguminosarum]
MAKTVSEDGMSDRKSTDEKVSRNRIDNSPDEEQNTPKTKKRIIVGQGRRREKLKRPK